MDRRLVLGTDGRLVLLDREDQVRWAPAFAIRGPAAVHPAAGVPWTPKSPLPQFEINGNSTPLLTGMDCGRWADPILFECE